MTSWAWFASLAPWIQGLTGGAAVTFAWEMVIKPGRERRALARALAEEVAINVRVCGGQSLLLEADPKQIPGDFRLSDVLFTAAAADLGKLDASLCADVIWLYGGYAVLNRTADSWPAALVEWRKTYPQDKAAYEVQGREMDGRLTSFRTGLRATYEEGKLTLDRLDRASRLWCMRWRHRPPVAESQLRDAAQQAAAAQRARRQP